MFGLGMTEMIVIGVIALLVVGPKDLPKLFKGIAGFMRQIRKLTREFQGVVNEMIRESDLDDLRKEARDLGKSVDPTEEIRNAMRETENEINATTHTVATPFAPVSDGVEATPPPKKSAVGKPPSKKTTPAKPAAAKPKAPASSTAGTKKRAPTTKVASAKKTAHARKPAASRSKASD